MRTEFRKVLMYMGFEEMPTNRWVESSFWNFDSLFQPQVHCCRYIHTYIRIARREQRMSRLPMRKFGFVFVCTDGRCRFILCFVLECQVTLTQWWLVVVLLCCSLVASSDMVVVQVCGAGVRRGGLWGKVAHPRCRCRRMENSTAGCESTRVHSPR